MPLEIREIPLDQIVGDETAREPDRRLLQSLERCGLCEPILVRSRADGQYDRIDGSRRIAAGRTLGWQTIVAIVESDDAAARPRDLQAVIVNTQRKNLRQLYVARHARRLVEQGHYVQAELARELHLSPATLSYMLTVLDCPELVASMETDGLEFGAAKALASLPPADRSALLQELVASRAGTGKMPSVRQIEQKVRERKGQPPLAAVSDAPLAALIAGLRARGAGVEIRSVRATQTRLKVTLTVAESDQEWVNELLDASKDSPHPTVQPGI
jgi:ParB/RepB/Spo0J family partition protein